MNHHAAELMLQDFREHVLKEQTLVWCVKTPNPAETLDEAWRECRSEVAMRNLLEEMIGYLPTAKIICDPRYTCRLPCRKCVASIRERFPSIAEIALSGRTRDA